MKVFLRLGLTLLGFCVVATALLAYVNYVTEPLIEQQKKTAAEQTMSKLIPGAVFEPITIHTGKDSLVYYIAKDEKTGDIKGYTFTAAKPGYSSIVKTMAAIDTNFKI
ncbi:MAG: electron transporter RnfG, partial [Candidatus Cloacimonetes bacterium]|nr:electron transporter RnfG [Candidatus Cloacimonadota bacterium]